jgi:membrane-associated phospholipid phosphatase
MQENFSLSRPNVSRCRVVFSLLGAALALGSCTALVAQAPTHAAEFVIDSASLPDAPVAHTRSQDEVTLGNLPRNFLCDQASIWTSPVRLRPHDLEWMAPLALATGAAIATDHRAMTRVVSQNTSFNNANVNASNALIGAWIAAPVAVYGWGHFENDYHAREAGILSAESMLDGVIVEQGMKLIFWRERPGVDASRGRFFQSSVGVDSSFPSSHSVIAWSAAAALAGETSSRWMQFALYSGAAGVSLTRVMGQQHFPSDVLVGSATGWLIGHYVVKRHHHKSLDQPAARN